MESSTKVENLKAAALIQMRSKIAYGAAITGTAFVLGRVPFMSETFPLAIGFIIYMVSKNPMHIYLVLPCGVGIMSCINSGCDSWGELGAMSICALIFALARNIELQLWQRGTIGAAVTITCISIYRLAMSSVYKASIGALVFEGVLVFVAVFLTEAFFQAIKEHEGGNRALTSLVVFCLASVCGMGMDFLIWAVIIFITLFMLVYGDGGIGEMTVAVSGITAFLAGQPQWGFMITLVMGVFTASFFKKRGIILTVAVFAMTCIALRSLEGGVVLGVDNYYLFMSLAAFGVMNWKFGSRIKKMLATFSGGYDARTDNVRYDVGRILTEQSEEMKELSELYSTYLDSRSMLSTQFDMTRQVIEETRWQIGRSRRRGSGICREKFHMDIAVSQCAATGEINGDCCGWHDIGNGRTVMVISDGMGKGKKAAAESLMVTKTIIGLLKSGVSAELTLKMINTIMVIKDDEDSFATVDLVISDRRTGNTKFYKIGAAPTMIRRKNTVEEVKLSEVPLGVVNGLKIKYVETFLRKGDCMVMMSDGISDAFDSRGKLDALGSIILNIRSENPQTIGDLILNQAADGYIGRERDDLTVLVARLV